MVSKQQAASIVAHKLSSALACNKVLLLLSGGSTSKLAAPIINSISDELKNNLFVTLADERYGPRDHQDSNWLALKNSGLDIGSIDHYIVLWEKKISREATALEFESIIRRRLHNKPTVIALLGIGEDGHTAGILPSSLAAEENHHLIVDYEAGGHQRITIAPPFFDHIDTCYLYAEGPEKQAVITKQETADNELLFPAALLRRCGHSVVLYNKNNS